MPMDVAPITVASLAIVATAATVAGCGGNDSAAPTTSSTTSSSSITAPSNTAANPSPGQSSDYSAWLIKPSDIGGDFTAPRPPESNPDNAAGVAQLFASADNSRRIWDTIRILA